jgi:N-acetylglucosaminyl-diphospho-decaprenol L-rhamnosyltransferase
LPVSVLIVNYRVYDELDRALTSIERVLQPDDELHVFDQVSDADARQRVAERHPRARILASSENLGFAKAINRLAAASTAPLLLWFNPDALVDGPTLETLEAWLLAHPSVGCVGPRVLNEDGTVQPSARRFPDWSTALGGRSTWLTRRFPDNALSRHNLPARSADAPVTVDWLAGSCLMTRRDLFERLGGLDEGFFLYWEDADYCRRAAAIGLTCTYLPTVAVRHAVGRSSSKAPDAAIRAFHASAYRLYRKYAGPTGRLLAPAVRFGLWARGEWLVRRARRQAGGVHDAPRGVGE